MPETILVIRHGALGDFVQSIWAFEAIRARHPQAKIILLTAPFLHDFAKAMPFFDEVWVDPRPRWSQIPKLWALLSQIIQARFSQIYDLQTSSRTLFYKRCLTLLRRLPTWHGQVKDPDAATWHTVDRQKVQLSRAGITWDKPSNFDWLPDHAMAFDDLLGPYGLIVPLASAHRPDKFYPIASFRVLIDHMLEAGLTPVIIGAKSDRSLDLGLSPATAERVKDLRGETTLIDLVRLGRQAKLAIGNDTGPMHLFAVAGCPSVVLFSKASNPDLCAPRGPVVKILQVDSFFHLPPQKVWDVAQGLS